MKVLQSSDILSSEIDRAQCQLQPLLLDRSCFVRKLDQLDASQIDKLDWNNLNRDFCDYWSYFASDDKKRQHMLRQIVDQKTNIDRSEKEEKCAAYLLRYISQSKQQPKGERLVSDLPVEKAESTISDEFVKCFRDGQSKANATVKRRRCERTEPAPAPAPYTNYQSEKRAILKQLKMCRNPYEVELLKQKLRRLKELEQRMSEAPERLLKHGKRTSDEAPAGRAPKPLKDKFLPYNTLTEDQLQRKIQVERKARPTYIENMHEYNPWNAANFDVAMHANLNSSTFSRGKPKDSPYTTNYQEQFQMYGAKLMKIQTKNRHNNIAKDQKLHEVPPAKAKFQRCLQEYKKSFKNPKAVIPINYCNKEQRLNRTETLSNFIRKENSFDKPKEPTATKSNDDYHFPRRQRKSKGRKRKHKSRELRASERSAKQLGKTSKEDQKSPTPARQANASGTQQYRRDLQTLQNYEQKLNKLKKLMRNKKREINAMMENEFEQREMKMNREKEYEMHVKVLKTFEQKINDLKQTNEANKQSKRKSIHVDGIEELNKHVRRLSKYSIDKQSTLVHDEDAKFRIILPSDSFSRKSMKKNKEEGKHMEQTSQATSQLHNSDDMSFNRKCKRSSKKSLHTHQRQNILEIEKLIQKGNEIESKVSARKFQRSSKENHPLSDRQLHNRIRYENFLIMLKSIEGEMRNQQLREVMTHVKSLKKLIDIEQKSPESLIDERDLRQLQYRVENLLYLRKIEKNKLKLQKQSLDKLTKLKTKSYLRDSSSSKYFASVKNMQTLRERASDYSSSSSSAKHCRGQQKKNSVEQEVKRSRIAGGNNNSSVSLATLFSHSTLESRDLDAQSLAANAAPEQVEAALPQELQDFLIEQRRRNGHANMESKQMNLDAIDKIEANHKQITAETYEMPANETQELRTFLSLNKVVAYKNPYGPQKTIDDTLQSDKQSRTSTDGHWPMASAQSPQALAMPFVAPMPKISLQNLIRRTQTREKDKQRKSMKKPSMHHAHFNPTQTAYDFLSISKSLELLQLQSQSSFSIQSISSGIDQSKRSKKPPIEREVQLENVEEEESRNDSEIWDILKQHPPLPMQPYMPEMLRKLKTLDLRIYYRQMMRSSNSAASEQQESSNLSICGNW